MTALLIMAVRYDKMGEKLIDQHMCTDICPCYSEETWLETEEGQKIRRIDPEFLYGSLNEQTLNVHNRTMKNKTEYIPMVFSKNEAESFKSFADCFNTYKANDEGDINEFSREFDLDYITTNRSDVIRHAMRNELEVLNLDLFSKIEEEYDCSGMCESALFYYSKSTSEGIPNDTCLKHLKNNLGSDSIGYAYVAVISSFFSLALFISSAFLYMRPEDQKGSYVPQQEGDRAY